MTNPFNDSPKFIVFEGPDGSGQTTQANLLNQHLTKQGVSILLTKEPTTTSKTADVIKKVLGKEIKVPPEKLQQLFTDDRKEHLEKEIMPALKEGRTVICDRYFFSSFAFGSLQCDLNWLIKINKKFPEPDLTFIINVRAETCIERIKNRGSKFDFFEEKEKLTKIMKNYLNISKMFGNIYVIDGEKTINKVHQQVLKVVNKKFPHF